MQFSMPHFQCHRPIRVKVVSYSPKNYLFVDVDVAV